MRKLVVAALILTLLLPLVFADQNETQENLYTLVVPTYYDMLFVTGSFGSGTAARLQIDLAPTAAFNFDVGAGANYDLFAQTVTTALSVDANLNSLFWGLRASDSMSMLTSRTRAMPCNWVECRASMDSVWTHWSLIPVSN